MKRVGYIYERMLDHDFIVNCIKTGTKDSRKRQRRDVRRVLDDVDGYVSKMQSIIESRSFRPSEPRHRVIYDPCSGKNREISFVPFFPDGLMHIMVIQAMMDVIMRGMSHWSCSSVPGRGGQRIRNRIRRVMRKDPKGTKYAAELDIKSYYSSISPYRLIKAFSRKIKDQKFLLLLAICLTCWQGSLEDAISSNMTWVDVTRGVQGICIGFYVSQWAANFYLESLDQLIETLSGVKYFVRYMDNITLFGPNKKKLHRARQAIEVFMREKLGLTMKGNWQVYPTKSRMVSAVGFRYARTHTILRKRNFLRLTRQCRRVKKRQDAGRKISFRQAAGLLSRIGQLKHCNSHTVRVKYVDPIGIRNLKEVVRNESKRRSAAQQCVHRGSAAAKTGRCPCPVL